MNAVEERNKQQAVVMIGYPGLDVLNKDRTALDLINEASNDLGSRFFNRIREAAWSGLLCGGEQFHRLAPGALCLLSLGPKKVGEVTVAFQDEINQLAKQGGLTPEELARAKKKPLGSEAILQSEQCRSLPPAWRWMNLVGLGSRTRLNARHEVEAINLDDIKRGGGQTFQHARAGRNHRAPAGKTASTQPPAPQS